MAHTDLSLSHTHKRGIEMDVAISAVASDLFSRFISYPINKFPNQVSREQKVERLQKLLLRVHTVVEEADGRYITNSGMLLQLNMLERAMYRGYHMLDTVKYKHLDEGAEEQVSDESSALYLPTPRKRFRLVASMANYNATSHEIQSTVDDLEAVVANMTEFAILLVGCERICKRPYDTYLYTDNFMFGHHSEKQQIITTLLQHNPLGIPTVLPIIGAPLVGKKTLVAHVCNDERVRSRFSSILHLNGENFLGVDCESYMSRKTLVVVEFVSDVGDEDWEKFYSSATCNGKGNNVIIISRLKKLARFGTVKPIRLNSLSYEEYSYLFKKLAFGSANPDDHPHLASVAKEFPTLLSGSLVSANAFANVLRKNMNIKFWLGILMNCRVVVEQNYSMFGEHPKVRLYEDHPIDITKFVPSSPAPLRLMPRRCETDVCKRELPQVIFGDLILDPTILPKGEFDLVMWESRMPPYTKTVHFVPTCDEEKPMTSSLTRKRRALFV